MPASPTRKRHVLPPRARTVVRVLVTGVALALVVLIVGVLANLAQPQSPKPSTGITFAPGEADYRAGLEALASGDTTKAVELLGKAAAAGNTAAQAKLDRVRPSTPTAPSVVASSAFDAPASDLATFLPDAVTGFQLAEVETSALSAIVAAEPAPSGPKTVSRLVVSVYDRTSAPGARSWLADFDVAYPKDNANVTVGTRQARFGTDGAHLASVAFVRGRYGFEVVVTAVNVSPKELKSVAVQAAGSLSAAR